MSRATSPTARYVALVLGCMAAATLGEMIMRVPLGPGGGWGDDWWARTRAMHAEIHQADPELIYAPRPDAQVEMDYGLAGFDDLGLRAEPGRPPPAPEAPAGTTRIAVVGDSLVWGELVPPDRSLPRRLEARLGAGYEVLNLGVTGYDTEQEAGWFERIGPALAPDAVVVVYCLNDTITMSGPFHHYASPEQLARYDAERAAIDAAAPVRNETLQQIYRDELATGPSRALAVLRHLARWHGQYTFGGYTDEFLLGELDPERVARRARALDRLGDAIRGVGAQPILVIAPAVYWWHRYPWEPIHRHVRADAEAAGFEVIDPLPAWRRHRERPDAWRFDGDNLHYNARGNDRFAETLAEALRPTLSEPETR